MPVRRLGRLVRRIPMLAGLPVEVAVLSAVAFCVALGFGIVGIAIPLFAREFGVTATAASAVVSAFALARLVSSPVSGWLVERLGERRILTTGLLIVAVSSALAGLSQSYEQLLLLRGLGGIGSSMFTVSAFALLLRVIDRDQRGRAAAAFGGGFLFGTVAGPAVGGLVVSISIRAPFFVYAVTLGAAAIVSSSFLRRTALHDPAPAGEDTGSAWDGLRAALHARAYVVALIVNLTNGFVVFGMRSSLIPFYVTESLSLDARWVTYGVFASAAAQAVLLGRAGRMTDLVGRRPAMLIGSTATLASVALLVLWENLPLFFVSMAIAGVAAAFLGAAPTAVVGDITGGQRSERVVTAFQMTSDVGAIAGPLATGVVLDATGSFPLAFGVGAVVAVLALAAVATMPETRPTTKDAPPTRPDGPASTDTG